MFSKREMLFKKQAVKNHRFCTASRKKAQQNETLHPMRTTHIPVDQGILPITEVSLPHANAVGQTNKTVTFDAYIISYI